MYYTSTQFKRLSESELVSLECEGQRKLPQPYREFMKTCGIGTYGGAIYINRPDFNLLKQYTEYDFWEFDNSPIRREQMQECVVIGNSMDGDYIAVHPDIEGYILFPRHSDRIERFPDHDDNFICTVEKIGYFLYEEHLEKYFEPVGSDSIFLHYSGRNVHDLIKRVKAAFQNDFLIENEDMCSVFFISMGGYVAFKFSTGYEVAVFYSNYGLEFYERIKKFLNENGCN